MKERVEGVVLSMSRTPKPYDLSMSMADLCVNRGVYAKILGIRSLRYSTTASGPFSTCKPWGIAWVLIPGLLSLAICWIRVLSSGVHIEAQNYHQSAVLMLTIHWDFENTYQDVRLEFSDFGFYLIDRWFFRQWSSFSYKRFRRVPVSDSDNFTYFRSLQHVG